MAACNNGAGGFKEGTSSPETHAVLPQGKLKIAKLRLRSDERPHPSR